LGGYDWSDQAEEGSNYALMAFSSSNSDSKVSNDSICSKSYVGNFELLLPVLLYYCWFKIDTATED
ncbi:hypothetical protein Tco_1305484, partial [Tanacetum coccineum]